jgi:uncharacterized glyoxalase superfamily protein PhnB
MLVCRARPCCLSRDSGGVGTARPAGWPQITPYLYYPDATVAVELLIRAFGFEEQSAFRDDEGTVWTATLRLGDGLVMVGPGLEGFGTMAVPEGTLATSRQYVYVDDVDAHCARARAEGATIVSDPAEHPGGNRQYIAADCGGQQWIFAQPIG